MIFPFRTRNSAYVVDGETAFFGGRYDDVHDPPPPTDPSPEAREEMFREVEAARAREVAALHGTIEILERRIQRLYRERIAATLVKAKLYRG